MRLYDTEPHAIRMARARRSLLAFTRHTFPAYKVNWHHELMAERLDQLASGEIDRLMILCPPMHGKSELVSRRFPAWLFGKNPDIEIITCSYDVAIAKRMNRDVQRIIDDDRYRQVFPDTNLSKKNVRAVAFPEKGAHIAIIDDPIKNAEQALEWYKSALHKRLEGLASVLLTLTPCPGDDLAGRILEAEPGRWVVLRLPAMSDEYEALWPEKMTREKLLETKKVLGSYYFNSLYQCDPIPADGNLPEIYETLRY